MFISSSCLLQLRNPNENFRYATVKDSAVEMYFKRQVELSTMYRKMEEFNYNNADDAIRDVKEGYDNDFIWLNYKGNCGLF